MRKTQHACRMPPAHHRSYQVQQAETQLKEEVTHDVKITRTPTWVDKSDGNAEAWGHQLDTEEAVRRLIRRDVEARKAAGEPALDHYE